MQNPNLGTSAAQPSATLQAFLGEVARSFPEGADAAALASAVLCSLVLRFEGETLDAIKASSPPAVQTLLQPCLAHAGAEPAVSGLDEFFQAVARHLHLDAAQSEPIARGVFGALRAQFTLKDLEELDARFPPELRQLWRWSD